MPNVQHANQSGIELHEDKRVKQPVRAASTANVTIATPGTTLDGVTLAAGDRVLLKNQTTTSQNGIYVWTASGSPLTRATDVDDAADFVFGFLTYVREGTANVGTYWTFTQSAAVTLGSTAITFGSFGAGSGTVTSVAVTVPSELSVSGSPVTSSGTIAITKATQTANTHYAGPASGGAAAPTFRATVAADLPIMGASGVSHAVGAVPDPGVSAGTTRFLREDASWQVPAGGGGGTSTGGGGSGALVPIMVIGPLTATQATLPFSGIPQTGFRNLRVSTIVRSTLAASNANLGIQFNGDAGSTYGYEVLADASGGLNRVSSAADTQAYVAIVPASTAAAGAAAAVNIEIAGYKDATYQKSAKGFGAFEQATSAGNQFVETGGGFWRNTAAITSLTLVLSGGSFDVGSYACLYGEMDTAGVLLTPASNLLYDSGVLTTTAAFIDTGTLSQSYRDLRIVVQGRSDTAATQTALLAQMNGDTTATYYWDQLQGAGTTPAASQGIGVTSAQVGNMAGATNAGLGVAGETSITIVNYTGTAFNKGWHSSGGWRLNETSGNVAIFANAGEWKSLAAVASVRLFPAAGSFVVGSSVRVYGEPVSAGGSAVGTGTRLRLSGNQSITTATATAITWDTEDSDADNQHYPSAANLTGTVAKTAASATLTGTSTLFTTELSVGQVISVPGTAAEKRVVIAIASATSLTVNSAFVNTASGQTAARVNSAVVFRQPGFYTLEANVYSAALSTGAVSLAYYLNSLTTATSGTAIGQRDPTAVNASAGYDLVVQRQFQQWDFVEVVWTQNSGGSVNVLADERTHWSISARPTVIVAVPYVNIQDQKTSGTAGGTFTSGADQTRVLNTIDSDTAGIATLASNQVTLPAGTYETEIYCTAISVGPHQALLYNATDAAVIKRGKQMQSSTTDGTGNDSVIATKFVLSAPKALEVRHRCTTTKTTDGFGVAGSFGTEVYTIAIFRKVG